MTIAAGQTASAADLLQEHNADGTHGGSSKDLTLPTKTTAAVGQGQINYNPTTGKTTVGDGGTARDIVRQGFDAEGTSTFGDGGTTDYAEFGAATGTFLGHGSARWTKAVSVPPGAWADGGTPGAGTILGQLYGKAFTIGDSHLVSFQLPKDMDITVNPTLKIGLAINEAYATANGEIQFQAIWSANPMDDTEDIVTPGATGTLNSGDANIPSVALHGTTLTIGTIAGLAAGDLLGVELKRIALDGGTNPTAEPVVYQFVFEYTADRWGSYS